MDVYFATHAVNALFDGIDTDVHDHLMEKQSAVMEVEVLEVLAHPT